MIKKIGEDYLYIISDWDVESIDCILDDIKFYRKNKELELNTENKVIIDALLIKGNSYNRFYEWSFDKVYESELVIEHKLNLKLVDIQKDSIFRQSTCEYYKNNPKILDDNVLVYDSAKFLIKEGYVI